MPLTESNDPDALVRLTVQVTRAQRAWLQDRSRRQQVRTVATIVRQVVQAAIDDERKQRDGAAA